MALTILDHGEVERHVMQLLSDATPIAGGIGDLTLVPRGRPQPGTSVTQWFRLVRVDVQDAAAGRQAFDGEPMRCEVTVYVNVCVRSALIVTNAYALSTAMGYVCALLRERRIYTADLGQTLVLERAEARQDGESDDDRGIQTGVVIARGWAVRTG
jgi:hypothetical protein